MLHVYLRLSLKKDINSSNLSNVDEHIWKCVIKIHIIELIEGQRALRASHQA